MRRFLGVAAIAALTGGVVLAPTDGGEADTPVAEPVAVQKAAQPDFLKRIRLAPARRVAPDMPSDEEAIQIAMDRAAELRAARAAGGTAALASLSDVTAPTPVAAPAESTAEIIPASATAAPAWQVAGSRVNLRAGPGTGHAIVGQANDGDALTPLGDTGGDWVQVRLASGQDAWIFARFLRRTGG